MFIPTPEHEAKVRAALRSRALMGCAFLDSFDPHWRSQVDIAKLDVSDEDCCMLAQLCGVSFDVAEEQLELCTDSERFGFYLDPDPFVEGGNEDELYWQYDVLTEIWQDLIAGEGVPESLPDYRAERALELA